jgi:hypothetical protein
VVRRLLKDPDGPLLTYDPRPFAILGGLFGELNILYSGVALDHLMKSRPPVLLDFLDAQNFGEALVEIRKHSASPVTFQKRFWRWFNMFRILKFIHNARQHGYPDIPVRDAAFALLRHPGEYPASRPASPPSAAIEEYSDGTEERSDGAEETKAAAEKIMAKAGQGYENTSTRSLLEIYRQWDRKG